MSSHEDAMRWARERQLQLQREARHNATPRFGPAVDGVLWRGIRPEGDADTSLQTPILSILDFPLKAGIDVRDESKPPRKLLNATLGYISSIPGCCGVEWGARLDAEAGILCLVYWDSAVAWHRFQHSLGCTPLIGLLSSSASNRCAKFAGRISGAPGLGEAVVRASPIVDVVSVTLGARHVSSPERRAAFQEMWNTLVASLTGGEGDGGLRHSHAVWLENNASTFGDPTPAEAAAATVSATFTAFLVWDEETYDGHGVEYLCDGLRTSLPPSRGNEPTSISRKAVQLINQVRDREAHDAPRQPVALLASLASILQGDFSRQCSADLFNLRAHAHQVLNSSISDAMAGKRLFPVPQGCFISQGELYEGNLPRIPEWRSRQEPLHGHHLVDVAWMQLKRRAVRTQGPRIYNRLNNEMSVLPGFVKAFWARDALDDTKLAVLTVWEHQHLQGAALHDHRRILNDFAASSVHLSSPLTHQSFPMARGPVGITWLDRLDYLELTCFYIPPGALERQLLEHAYAAFARMTVPSQQGGIPAACTVIDDAGGWQPAEASASSGCQVFTAVLAWTSPAARLEWYEELAGASGWSYEMFGHKLDALKLRSPIHLAKDKKAPSRARLLWLALSLLSFFVLFTQALDHGDIGQITEQNVARRKALQAEPRADTADSAQAAVNKLASISPERVSHARAIVAKALKEVTSSNKARWENPQRNNWSANPASTAHARRDTGPGYYNVTSDVAAAAALVAQMDAAAEYKNGTLYRDYSRFHKISKRRQPLEERAGGYWMANLDNLGTQPFGSDASYKVFRNVKDYGAKGDGVTDDTVAINNAITDGNRCGEDCYGSSVKGAVVYFPPGTYLVSGSIVAYFHTQMVGDPTSLPVIKAAASFVGLGVISTDVYVPNGGTGIDGNSKEWYINTANFYRQIRNFIIDITATDQGAFVAALHYQVAQATSLTNIQFVVSQNAGTTQQAIYAENGSGGFMSDLIFEGGAFGIYGGNQQFTAMRLQFINCVTAIKLIWDWGWIWREIHISGSQTGISLLSEDGVHHTGSLLVQDSTFTNTNTAILTFPPVAQKNAGTTGITLDNVAFSGVSAAIADNAGKTWLAGSVGQVDTYTIGPALFSASGDSGNYTLGTTSKTPRLGSLAGASNGLPKSSYFSREKPLYEGATIVQMKWHAKGDGVTDDTAAFQGVINQYAGTGTVIFVDAGSYILTDTITIPSGTKIVGQCWSQLVASGAKFQDASNPHVLFRVGAEGGETGNVEIQDLLFTTKGPTAGLVAVEWNMDADGQGTAAMWDSHVRIGGADGTDLSVADCPAVTSGTDQKCTAGAMMFHVTPSASAYIENMWLWTADHDLDDDNMAQISVYVARGMLIESVKPVWLYGTASEHAVFYQYEFYQAQQVLAAMIQTETPYYQPNPLPPFPFAGAVGAFPGDPDYNCPSGKLEGCDASWAVRMVSSSNSTVAGAGLYSWFQTFTQTCVDTQNCQISLVQMKDNSGDIHFWNLITIGSLNMISSDAGDAHTEISALNYTNVDYHPFWSQLSLFEPLDVPDDGGDGGNLIYVPTTIWAPGSGGATASCIPPCTLVLPPSQIGSTTTISWPPLTTTLLSSKAAGGGIVTITTTISIPAITTTAVDWWPVTVNVGDPTTAVISVVQSVKPPPVQITLPPGVAIAPPSLIPVYSNGVPVSSSTSSTTATVIPVFFPTPHPGTIQPQPTVVVSLPTKPPSTITLPPSTTTFGSSTITIPPVTTTKRDIGPVITYTSAKPTSTCHGSGCGTYDCHQFGCGGGCGIFGCNNGCSIFGCGGGCGLFGCGGGCLPLIGCPAGNQCPLNKCGGPGCKNGGCGTQSEGDCEPQTANDCTLIVSSTLTASPGKYSTTTRTNCHPYAECDATDKTTTTTQTGTESSFGTATVTASNRDMGRQPASLVNSLASQIISEQYSWDLTRFSAMPTGGGGKTVPTGPNGEDAAYWTWFMSHPLSAGALGLGTYNGRPDECAAAAEWADASYSSSVWIHDAQGITVFGDLSCSYTATFTNDDPPADTLLGTLSCSKWEDAKCYKDGARIQTCGTLGNYDFPMAYCNWK